MPFQIADNGDYWQSWHCTVGCMTVSSAFGGQSCFSFTLHFEDENLCETEIEFLGEPEKFPHSIPMSGGGTQLFGTAHREIAPSKNFNVILNVVPYKAMSGQEPNWQFQCKVNQNGS
jgi:hypothetical protein